MGGAKPPPPKPPKDPASVHQAMGWDDEELDTQIFDKEEVKPVAAEDLFFEDDDRTVANEPAPDILEQARPPELLLTPKPVTLTPELSEEINVKLTPPPAARPLPPPGAARRPTLVGVAPAGMPARATGPVPTLPPPGPPQGRPGAIRRSSMSIPPVNVAAPSLAPPPQRMPTPMAAPPPQQRARFREPTAAPFGTGSFETVATKRPARRGIGVLLVVAAAAAGVAIYVYNNNVKPGRIELNTVPADATVLIDNTKVGDHSPVSLEKPPGPYTLSVTRDGYGRSDQNIELKAGQPLSLTVTLEPSPDTGFELMSDPPGGLVWLDGAAVKESSGQQARTNFRASRISPGHHKLEIKGDRFKPWDQDVEIEPGKIRQIRATLIPLVGGPIASATGTNSGSGKATTLGAAPPPSPGHEVAMPTSQGTAVSPPVAVVPPAQTQHKGGGGGGTTSSGLGTGPSTAGGGGAVASPGAGAGAKKRRQREAPSDDGTGEAPSEDTPAPRRQQAVATDDSGGGDCSITINSVPWSEVWIDGKNTTKHTPVVDFKVPCGKHKLNFKRPDMQIDQTEPINVKPGQNFKQRYTLATDD
jgi:hypothetical protein